MEVHHNERHRAEILDYFGSHPQYMYLGSNRQNMFIIEKKKVDRKLLRRIDFKKYIAAEQHHPISERLAIQSVPPSLNRGPEFRLLAASWLERVFRL